MLSLPRATRRNLLRLDRELLAAARRHEAAVQRCDAWGEIDRLELRKNKLAEAFAVQALAAMRSAPLMAAMFALAELPDAEALAAEDPMETVNRFRTWLRASANGGAA